MDKLYLATIEVAYNNDKLYYVHTKKKWYILKSDMFLDELFRKYSNGCLCYKEKGGVKAFYYEKMKKNAKKCNVKLPIGLPIPF